MEVKEETVAADLWHDLRLIVRAKKGSETQEVLVEWNVLSNCREQSGNRHKDMGVISVDDVSTDSGDVSFAWNDL